MPDLPIGSENGLHFSQDLFRVYAFMAHPRSEELRHQFLARMHETVAAEVQPLLEAVFSAGFSSRFVGAQLGEWLQPLGGFPTLTASPSARDALMRLRDSAWPGSIAGDLLIYLQQTRVSGIKPSINKALALVVCSLKGATNARGKPRGRSSRYIRKQWEEFKPAAHLWAAYRAILFANLQGKNQPEMSTDEGLPFFLALAEWFAEEGLSIYPHSRKQPVLDSSELWRVPAALRSQWPLLEVEQAPLPEWALEALRREYKGLRS